MKKCFVIFGRIIIAIAIIFILIHSFVKVSSGQESFSRDIFGLPMYNPPLWTSYIPYFGNILVFLFELFSLHGLVGIIVFTFLMLLGIKLTNFDKAPRRKNE